MRALLPLLVLSAGVAAAADLADYVVENGASIPEPLADWDGGPEPGAALYREKGCADCHEGGGAAGLAAGLADVSERLTQGEIRLMIVEPRIVFPDTAMPAYYTPGEYGSAPEELVGRTRLTALEVEQLVAFLSAPGRESEAPTAPTP